MGQYLKFRVCANRTMTRESINIQESYVIIRGLLTKGVIIYGPFLSRQEAVDYCGKNFPNDTREIAKMIKEETTHGGDR
jgi:hypothetical protein